MAIGLSRRLFATLGAGLVLPDLTALAGLGKSAQADLQAAHLPAVGNSLTENLPEAVPPFHFLDASGRRLTLAHYRGEGLVVNFWATWCPPCRAELPTLVAFNRLVLPDGIRVLPISVDSQGIAAVAPYYKARGIVGVPMLFDRDSSGLRVFHESGIPFTIIVNRKSEVVASLEGAGNWDNAATVARVRRLVGPVGRAAKPGVTAARAVE